MWIPLYHSATGGLLLSVVVSTICVIVVAVVKKCRGKVFLCYSCFHPPLVVPNLLTFIPGKQTVSEAEAVVKIPMQTNTAYENHQVSRRHQPPQMKPCAVYGIVGTDSRAAVSSSHV